MDPFAELEKELANINKNTPSSISSTKEGEKWKAKAKEEELERQRLEQKLNQLAQAAKEERELNQKVKKKCSKFFELLFFFKNRILNNWKNVQKLLNKELILLKKS